MLDAIVGHGVTARDSRRAGASGSVTAHDGRNGVRLWEFRTTREVVSTPTLADLNGDGVSDPILGARDGVFFALNGRSGAPLWTFKADDKPGAPGRLNHYSPARIPDVDGDGVVDLVQTSGGDVSIPAGDPRPPGHLLLVSGRTGKLLAAARTPDGGETYTSPLISRGRVIFGTGGETHPGGLWAAKLADLRKGDLSAAKQLTAATGQKGLIAPPALADLTGDGVEDVVAAFFDGRVVAINGATDATIWSHAVPGGETHFSPVVGQFGVGPRPDVFALINVGTWPRHHASEALWIDGDSGRIAVRRRLKGIADGTPVAVDTDGDGRDEVLYWERRGDDTVVLRWDMTGDPVPMWTYVGRTPSTPWVGDLDGDGVLDWLHAFMSPPRGVRQQASHQFEASVTWTLQRRALGRHVPAHVAFGAYLGTRGDGRYP